MEALIFLYVIGVLWLNLMNFIIVLDEVILNIGMAVIWLK